MNFSNTLQFWINAVISVIVERKKTTSVLFWFPLGLSLNLDTKQLRLSIG